MAPKSSRAKYIVLGALAFFLAVSAGYFAIPEKNHGAKLDLRSSGGDRPMLSSDSEAAQDEIPGARHIAEGEIIKWDAASGETSQNFSSGNLSLSIDRVLDDGLYKPRLTVRAFGQTLVMDGSATDETFPHQFSLVRLKQGGELSVLFQSFSGGAHCCNHIQIAQLVRGRLVAVDLGSMDGDYIPTPHDIDGDGVLDFEFSDDAFLYAFAPYAMSYTPSRFMNVLEGKVLDVSAHKAFRKKDMLRLPELADNCRNGADGNTRNGACAAFVAVAARVGRLSAAWPTMVDSYDASVDWEFPEGCPLSSGRSGCSQQQQVMYQSYPDALLNFLKRLGYIPRTWIPPEAFATPDFTDKVDYEAGSDI